ncbi:hypothetical protein Golob_026612, partial [Gossypium lobatum]|nr:hypothetical protein [Gossypium lobatum]
CAVIPFLCGSKSVPNRPQRRRCPDDALPPERTYPLFYFVYWICVRGLCEGDVRDMRDCCTFVRGDSCCGTKAGKKATARNSILVKVGLVMDAYLTRLSLEDREEEGWDVIGEDSGYGLASYKLCLVRMHNISNGLMSKVLAKQFGNFISQLIEYDMEANIRNFQNHMRIRDASIRVLSRKVVSNHSRWLREYIEIKGMNFVSSNLGNKFSNELDLEDQIVNQISTNLGLNMGGTNGLGINGGKLIDFESEDCSMRINKGKKKEFHSHFINVDITNDANGKKLRLTGFYGALDERFRRESWNLLRQLGKNML